MKMYFFNLHWHLQGFTWVYALGEGVVHVKKIACGYLLNNVPGS